MPETLRRRPDGFLERGAQVTRIEAFVDAAFAFAVTVMIVRIFDGAGSPAAMLEESKRLPGFFASFLMIAMFWWAHQTWSRRYGLDDPSSIRLGLVLVFLVGLYVYPLQMTFQSGIAFLTRFLPEAWHLPWGAPIETFDELVALYTIYGIAWSTLGLVIAGLYRRAWAKRDVLELDVEERVATAAEIARWLWLPVTGAISIALAWTIRPDAYWMLGLPGMAYALMSLTGVVCRLTARRVRPRLAAELAGR